MKWQIILIIALAFLVACAPVVKETTNTPVVQEQEQSNVNESQVLQPEVSTPVIEEQPVKQEQPAPNEKPKAVETISANSPEVTFETSKPQKVDCEGSCALSCEESAYQSCTQNDRSSCKSLCGTIIDPSACSQACTYLNQPQSCKSQFEQFCKAQCVGLCR